MKSMVKNAMNSVNSRAAGHVLARERIGQPGRQDQVAAGAKERNEHGDAVRAQDLVAAIEQILVRRRAPLFGEKRIAVADDRVVIGKGRNDQQQKKRQQAQNRHNGHDYVRANLKGFFFPRAYVFSPFCFRSEKRAFPGRSGGRDNSTVSPAQTRPRTGTGPPRTTCRYRPAPASGPGIRFRADDVRRLIQRARVRRHLVEQAEVRVEDLADGKQQHRDDDRGNQRQHDQANLLHLRRALQERRARGIPD